MTAIDWRIPASTLSWLEAAPTDRPVAVLLRHSVRPHLPPGDEGFHLPLTEDGERLALTLGASLAGRLRSVHASPTLRTMRTGELVAEGAGADVEVRPSTLLGHPGVFVVDGVAAGAAWRERGHEEVMARIVANDVLPGLAHPASAARFLVRAMLPLGAEPGLHVHVTHDSLVTAVAAHLLGEPLGKGDWPLYLGSAWFWEEGSGTAAAYRERHAHRPGWLCTLSDEDVVGFARREVAATLGLDCPSRFFLAGGCFKSLLTGRAPRDLDLWTPSELDRRLLIDHIRQRGGQALDPRPFADAFALGDRVLEVPHKTTPSTLEARLERFDLGLSAVGVEHLPRDQWRAVVHFLARRSVERGEVLMLKPLVNWKYALTTLERMRRYADELGFRVPEEEEEEVWRVYERQSPALRVEMLARLHSLAGSSKAIEEEAACRTT